MASDGEDATLDFGCAAAADAAAAAVVAAVVAAAAVAVADGDAAAAGGLAGRSLVGLASGHAGPGPPSRPKF